MQVEYQFHFMLKLNVESIGDALFESAWNTLDFKVFGLEFFFEILLLVQFYESSSLGFDIPIGLSLHMLVHSNSMV